jgi:broad specificity phosphatase PhoE
MPKLYVVRHAEPALTGVLLGRTDPPLSEAGRRDAREKLGRLQVEVTYTSPLRRCQETAEAIEAPVEALDGLAEISLGEWDGLSWDEVERRDPTLARRKTADWFRVTPPGGEPWIVFAERVMQAVDKVLQGPLPAAIVAHAATNSVIAQRLGGADPGGFDQPYCEIREYDVGSEAAD